MFSSFAKLLNIRWGAARRTRQSIRLMIETLEDRVVPSAPIPPGVQFSLAALTPTVYVENDLAVVSTVTLTKASAGTVTVDYATSDDTAVAGTDYAAASGMLTFTPGQTSQTIDVNILGPVGDSNNEFYLALSDPSGANLGTPSTQTVTFTVANPVSLANPGSQSNYDGDVVSLATNAADALGDKLSYSAPGLPSGLSINSSTGAITGTIASNADAESPYSVTITATDATADASASQTFTWTVANPVSLTNPGSQSNYDGDKVNLPISASDAESNALSYAATGLPAGLSINASTGAISGSIATNADTGSPYAATVTATDSANGASASQSFSWAVSPVTVAITSPGDQSNYDGDTVSLSLDPTDSAGHPLAYTETGLPPGLYVSRSGVIEGTIAPGADAGSPYDGVTITATDSAADVSDTITFNWTISPVTVSLTQPADQSNFDGDPVSLQLSASDGAGHQLTYYVDPSTPLPSGLYLDPFSGEISGTIAPGSDVDSPYSINVTALDAAAGVGATQTFTWTVSPVTVSLTDPPTESNYDGDAATLGLSATDSAGHTLCYSVSADTPLPSGLMLDSQTGAVSGTIDPGDDAAGPYTITVAANDWAAGVSASQTFTWDVSAVSVSLTSPGNQTNSDGDVVALQLAATDNAGHPLVYSVDPSTPLPSGLTLDPGSGRIYGEIGAGDDGPSPYIVTLIAGDSAADVETEQTITWTVDAATPPSYESVTTLENTPVTLTTTDFGMTCCDSDVEITTLPTGGTLTDNGTPVTAGQYIPRSDITSNLLAYSPNTFGNGTAYDRLMFELEGRGDVMSDATPLLFNVTWVNQAPSFTASNPPAVDENFNCGGQPVLIPNWATFNAGAPNQGWETATYTVTNVSNPALFLQAPTLSANGTLSYTVAPLASGTSTFDVQAENNGGTANGGCDAGAVEAFTVKVNAEAPTIRNGNNAGPGSLRYWVNIANRFGGAYTFDFAPGVNTVTLTSGLTINSDVTIVGSAQRTITILRSNAAGTPNFSVFTVNAGKRLALSNLTITGGSNPGMDTGGGGINNSGTVVANYVSIVGNSGTLGGGVLNGRGASFQGWGCYFGLDSAADAGGGVSNSGTMDLYYTYVGGNTAPWGGGIVNEEQAALTIEGFSEIVWNRATHDGGGIFNKGGLTVSDAWLINNTAGGDGGGLYNGNPMNPQATANFSDCLIESNQAGDPNNPNNFGFGGGAYGRSGRIIFAGGCTLSGNGVLRGPNGIALAGNCQFMSQGQNNVADQVGADN